MSSVNDSCLGCPHTAIKAYEGKTYNGVTFRVKLISCEKIERDALSVIKSIVDVQSLERA